jgi:GTP-binding protein YchF
MNLSLGIVGLPNVGKSTLFNALTNQSVVAANYPFATIDPNHGVVQVADDRVDQIAKIESSKKIVPAIVEFVDIAGLVKGASEGEGLGNKFLGNIKETTAIVHVVRAFADSNITHVENSVDPKRDIDLINFELILKDIETVNNRISSLAGKARSDKKAADMVKHFEDLVKHLESEKMAIDFPIPTDEEQSKQRKELFLITDKKVIYLVNTEDETKDKNIELVQNYVGEDKLVIGMDFRQESELATMEDEDRKMFMEELGIAETGINFLTRVAYELLDLMSYFTAGPMEARAWTITKGTKAPQAAGVIHGDIEANFIAAEIANWEDFVTYKGWAGCKENGKVRLEGKEYVMQDGDVVLFKHNA